MATQYNADVLLASLVGSRNGFSWDDKKANPSQYQSFPIKDNAIAGLEGGNPEVKSSLTTSNKNFKPSEHPNPSIASSINLAETSLIFFETCPAGVRCPFRNKHQVEVNRNRSLGASFTILEESNKYLQRKCDSLVIENERLRHELISSERAAVDTKNDVSQRKKSEERSLTVHAIPPSAPLSFQEMFSSLKEDLHQAIDDKSILMSQVCALQETLGKMTELNENLLRYIKRSKGELGEFNLSQDKKIGVHIIADKNKESSEQIGPSVGGGSVWGTMLMGNSAVGLNGDKVNSTLIQSEETRTVDTSSQSPSVKPDDYFYRGHKQSLGETVASDAPWTNQPLFGNRKTIAQDVSQRNTHHDKLYETERIYFQAMQPQPPKEPTSNMTSLSTPELTHQQRSNNLTNTPENALRLQIEPPENYSLSKFCDEKPTCENTSNQTTAIHNGPFLSISTIISNVSRKNANTPSNPHERNEGNAASENLECQKNGFVGEREIVPSHQTQTNDTSSTQHQKIHSLPPRPQTTGSSISTCLNTTSPSRNIRQSSLCVPTGEQDAEMKVLDGRLPPQKPSHYKLAERGEARERGRSLSANDRAESRDISVSDTCPISASCHNFHSATLLNPSTGSNNNSFRSIRSISEVTSTSTTTINHRQQRVHAHIAKEHALAAPEEGRENIYSKIRHLGPQPEQRAPYTNGPAGRTTNATRDGGFNNPLRGATPTRLSSTNRLTQSRHHTASPTPFSDLVHETSLHNPEAQNKHDHSNLNFKIADRETNLLKQQKELEALEEEQTTLLKRESFDVAESFPNHDESDTATTSDDCANGIHSSSGSCRIPRRADSALILGSATRLVKREKIVFLRIPGRELYLEMLLKDGARINRKTAESHTKKGLSKVWSCFFKK